MFILLIGFNIMAGEEIICSFLNGPELELKCKNKNVIHVVAMKVGYVHKGTLCDEIEKRMGEFSQCFDDIPFELSVHFNLFVLPT